MLQRASGALGSGSGVAHNTMAWSPPNGWWRGLAEPETKSERTKVFMLSAVFVCLHKEPHPTVQLW